MKSEKVFIQFFGVLFVALVSFGLLTFSIPKAPARLIDLAGKTPNTINKERIQLVAIGDSLTKGVGDETNRGGYVPLVANQLQESFELLSIETKNYGVSGNRTNQVLKRIKNEEEIQKNLATADIITLSVGGNDLMKVIQNNIFGLTVKTFEKPGKTYQKNLSEVITEIRAFNQTAPIYLLGIYNPFYIYFPEVSEMQSVVDEWNQKSEEVTKDFPLVYFVPINDLLYEGILDTDDSIELAIEADSLNDLRNNALFEGDKFHPNYNGYQIIAKEFYQKMSMTKNTWLRKEQADE